MKPGFFQNEHLAELPPETRLLFIGLWLMADREGRLEDRPKRIKMQVFPADTYNVEPMLCALHDAGLILRYSVDSKDYICIPAWHKHQNPHVKEKASTIPAPDLHSAGRVISEARPADSLIPDSGFLIPDKPTARSAPFDFDEFKSVYPKRTGDQGWPKALRACNARVKEGEDWQTILAGARRYRTYCDVTGTTDTPFVKQAATFCGPDKHYLQLWAPPLNKGERIQDKNIKAALDWLEASNGT